MVCSTLARLHMNGRLWVNDPDCLIIRKDVFWAAFTYLETKWPLVLLEKRPHKLESHWGFYIGIHLYNKFFSPKTLGPIHYFRSQFHQKKRANKTDIIGNEVPCRCPEVPLAEAQALASVVAFSGGSVIFSDDVTTLEKAGKVSTTTAVGPRCSMCEIFISPTFTK